MAKKDRTGNRKTRDQRKQFKVPELGYYLIVTDTEATERCFFAGIHQAVPEDVGPGGQVRWSFIGVHWLNLCPQWNAFINVKIMQRKERTNRISLHSSPRGHCV